MLNKRWSYAAVVIAAGWCLLGAAPAFGTIVANGGFETGTGTDADNWAELAFPFGSATASSQRVSTDPHSGSWHLALSVAGAPDGGPAAEGQQQTALFSVTPGEQYDFGVYAKRAGALGPGIVAELNIQWLDSDGSHGGGVKGGTGFLQIAGALTETYQPFEFTGVTAAADSDAALVKFRLAGGAFTGSAGTVYFDDAFMTPEPATLCLLALGGAVALRRRTH